MVTANGRQYHNATVKMQALKPYATRLAERGEVAALTTIRDFVVNTIDQHGKVLEYLELCLQHASKANKK